MKLRSIEILLDITLLVLIILIMYNCPFTTDSIPKSQTVKERDYSLEANIDIILNLQKSKWVSLNQAERIEIIRSLADFEVVTFWGYIPQDYNIEITSQLNKNVNGTFDSSTKTIYLDSSLILKKDPKKLISTLFHELTHLIQHKYVEIYNSLDENDQTLLLFRDIDTYKIEFENYKSTNSKENPSDYASYYSQLCEQDARKYSKERTEYYYKLITDYLESEKVSCGR